MIYCYYDKEGILREIINDSDNRQGTNNDEIFVYTERDDVNKISVVYAIGDVRYPQNTSITQFDNGVRSDLEVPYNKNINYKYFKDNTPYNFYKFIVPTDIMQHNGTCRATFSIHSGDQNQSDEQIGKATRTLGLLTFDIQDSVINKDDILTLSQWQYLLEEMAKVLQLRSRGVIGTNIRPTAGGVAPDNLDDGMFVLYYGTKTGEYTTTAGESIRGIELYEISGRTYQLRYESFSTSDMSLANQREIIAHNQLYVQLRTLVEELAAQHLEFVKSDELSEVAFTGEYADLKGKPSIPTKVSDLTNDSGFITNAVSDLINYYTKSEILTKDEIIARIGAIKTIKFEIYSSLDKITNPQTNVIYLIGTDSPYTEYAYIEDIGFEAIGSTDIDLSSYVQSDDTLNTDKIVVGNGDKKVKDSGFTINSQSKNGVLLNDDTKVPTGRLVMQEIQKYHTLYTINGDTGTIAGISYGTSPYFLIVDENLLVYRRISNENYHLVYHAQQVLDNGHIRDWYLKFGEGATTNDYVRTYVENVSHAEFDELVENTPTDVIYDKNTKVVQLTHDGMPIGEGAVVDINGFTPYFDNKTLVLSDVEELNADVATREWVNENTIVDLEEIPSIVDEKSPDLISVGSVVYYKKLITQDNVDNLTNTTWTFNDTLSITSYNKWNINFNGYIKTPSYMGSRVYTSFTGLFTNIEVHSGNRTTINFLVGENQMGTGEIYADGWNAAFEVDRNIEVIGGQDVENTWLILFLKENATLTSVSYGYSKLSWTKEELKDTYVLKLDEWVYPNSYSTYNVTKEQLDLISKFDKVLVSDSSGFRWLFQKSLVETNVCYSNVYGVGQTADLTLGYDEGSDYYIYITCLNLIDYARFEELVNEVPTDVSIIEDQGKLELMLEHDGNVLAVNDTPNQFLQRRLDKPSAEWTRPSGGDVKAWLQSKLPQMYVGQFMYIHDDGTPASGYGMITGISDNGSINFVPIALTGDYEGIPKQILINSTDGTMTIKKYNDVADETINMNNDIYRIKLY